MVFFLRSGKRKISTVEPPGKPGPEHGIPSLLVFRAVSGWLWVMRLCGYLSSVQSFNCMLKWILNRLNPVLCMGITASIDIVIIRLSSVFKITVKEILYKKKALAISLPIYEVTASTFCFSCCTLKLFRVFTQSFVIWLIIKISYIFEFVYRMHF